MEPIEKNKNHTLLLLSSLIILLIILGAVAVIYKYKDTPDPLPSPSETPVPSRTSTPSPTSTGSEKPSVDDLKSRTKVRKYSLEIDWNDRPIEVSTEKLPIGQSLDGYYMISSYDVGTITNGTLKGMGVYIIYYESMGSWPELVALDSETYVAIKEWVPEMNNLPEIVKGTSTGAEFLRDPDPGFYIALLDLEDMAQGQDKLTEISVNDSELEKLYSYRQCFFARTPSDLLVEYVVDIPFIEETDSGSYYNPEVSFTSTDGTEHTAEYQIYDTVNYGCGSLCSPLKVVEDKDFEDKVVKAGTTDTGHNIYKLIDDNDSRLIELYNEKNTRAYVNTSEGRYESTRESKYTYEEYLDIYPLIYWKDSLGRWAEFKNIEFIILAERCKPVIYLYPEEETSLHVEVESELGFTKTIPEYNDGWDITALPDGTIIDDQTGEHYPYLYWADWVQGYPPITEGWVIASNDLEDFLTEKLQQLGMQGKEIDDFNEYWVPRLSESPYYAISFLDRLMIDKLSPLKLSQDPDTVIRILMTAQPLEKPIELPLQILPEPQERNGFTVVEWGGVLLR